MTQSTKYITDEFRKKRYKSENNEGGIEDMILERKQSQTHVGEDEVFCQKIQELKQLRGETRENN